MKNELQMAIAIAAPRAPTSTPALRIHRHKAQKVSAHNGTCRRRMARIAVAPVSLRTSAVSGAKTNHCRGVWCSQKSR